ncbi:MAG: HNH endonuclease [Flavipsychrobacter sp.]|nr:HNH endonuclease [Flavipsychrobacter sp.]
MATCYSCHTRLNRKNQSWEHIIPSALGGSTKSRRILCKTCNEKAGSTIDQALAAFCRSQLEKFGIQPDRINSSQDWKPQPFTTEMVVLAVHKILTNFYFWKWKPASQIIHYDSIQKHLQVVPLFYPEMPLHLIYLEAREHAGWMTGYIELFGEIGFIVKFETGVREKNSAALFLQDPVHKKEYITTAGDRTQIIEYVKQHLQTFSTPSAAFPLQFLPHSRLPQIL